MLLGEWPGTDAMLLGEWPGTDAVLLGEWPGTDAMLLGEWPGTPQPIKESVTSLKTNPRQHRSENLKYYIIKLRRC